MSEDVVHVIIPTVEGRENVVLNCIISLLSQTYKKWDLTICSTNPNIKIGVRTDNILLNRFLGSVSGMEYNIRILHDAVRQGPGYAIEKAINDIQGKHILRLNDDVVLTPDVLYKLVSAMELDEKVAAVASPVNAFGVPFVNYQDYWSKTAYQPHLRLNGSYLTMNDNFAHHSCVGGFEIAEVDFLSGHVLLLDKDKLESIGGYYNEKAPKSHREAWWTTLRLREHGYRLWVRGDAIAFHHHYSRDEADLFKYSVADKDKYILDKYRSGLKLQENRGFGRITESLRQKG
jgi:GT2 family glycosyltransferase